MNTTCIICDAAENRETVEHIIPKSLGNEYYVLPKGVICFNCNNRIARVETRVVSSELFLNERKRYGLIKDPDNHHCTELEHGDLVYLVIKMGYEGLYASKRRLWNTCTWKYVKEYLLNHKKYPGLNDRNVLSEITFKPIPGFLDRFRLRNHHLTLEYGKDQTKVYIRFQFGRIRTWIRMI